MDILTLIKHLHNISGARVSVHSVTGDELYACPSALLPFCAKIQKKVIAQRACEECDKNAYSKLSAINSPYIYRCSCGLLEAIAPIRRDGEIAGYLMMGQVTDANTDNKDHILKSSRAFFDNDEEQLEYFNKILTLEYNKFESYAQIMGVLAEYVTNYNRFFYKADGIAELTKKYIHQNFAKPLTLNSIAKRFECSKSTVMNQFKSKYGVSVIAYLNTVRLKEAKKLICDTELSFKEIAAECGFYDQNYFSKQFSENFGCSPTEFRKEYKKSKGYFTFN